MKRRDLLKIFGICGVGAAVTAIGGKVEAAPVEPVVEPAPKVAVWSSPKVAVWSSPKRNFYASGTADYWPTMQGVSGTVIMGSCSFPVSSWEMTFPDYNQRGDE